MSTQVQHGQEVNISQLDPSMRQLIVCFGWQEDPEVEKLDVDATAMLVNAEDKVARDEDFVFYNNPKDPEGYLEHMMEDVSLGQEGDRQIIKVDLLMISGATERIPFVLGLYEWRDHKHNFTMVHNMYVRLVNAKTETEILRFDMPEGVLNFETGLIIGELYREGIEWGFRAVGKGHEKGLGQIGRDLGVLIQAGQ